MEEIECSLIRHFENNLRLRSKTGYAEVGYSEMDAPGALVFRPLVKGNEALGTRLQRGILSAHAPWKVLSMRKTAGMRRRKKQVGIFASNLLVITVFFFFLRYKT